MPNRIVISETGGPEVLKYEKYNLNDKNNEVKVSMEIASKAASISTTKMGGAISIPKL